MRSFLTTAALFCATTVSLHAQTPSSPAVNLRPNSMKLAQPILVIPSPPDTPVADLNQAQAICAEHTAPSTSAVAPVPTWMTGYEACGSISQGASTQQVQAFLTQFGKH